MISSNPTSAAMRGGFLRFRQQNSCLSPSTVWIPLHDTIPTTSPGYLLTSPDRYGGSWPHVRGSWQDRSKFFLSLNSFHIVVAGDSLPNPAISYLCPEFGLRHRTIVVDILKSSHAPPSPLNKRTGKAHLHQTTHFQLLRYVARLKILALLRNVQDPLKVKTCTMLLENSHCVGRVGFTPWSKITTARSTGCPSVLR